ncbi:MAG: 16S rRNA (adenine(1518)-N(6)/adenine(1519)-N(6))-dimethyltransferase RsmA [archaeon]|nr:16S rRNA (adenine(1518)-N(6)/adenine(1519)-N(6))-dimethyltransferase RsmA [archaeon]
MNYVRDFFIRPVKKHGQNFLVDKNIIRLEIDEADISKNDTVLEVGGGYGALTFELAKKAKKVIVIELDDSLVSILETRIEKEDIKNVEVIHGDALKIDFPDFDKCVSNIPYQISSKVVEMLGKYGKFSLLIMQKEFAQRLVAVPGDKNYSRISILTQFHFVPVFVRKVGRKCFYPSPSVDSGIVKLFPRAVKVKVCDEKLFFRFVTAVFIHKNQKLWKALSHSKRDMKMDKAVLSEIGRKLTDADVRVRVLDIERLAAAADEFYGFVKKSC